jgi:hypothetical protein
VETVKRRQSQIWVAGGTELFKYFQERNASALTLSSGAGGTLRLSLTCGTDQKLYDQSLTIELAVPDGWSADALKVKDGKGAAVATRTATAAAHSVVRFDVPPVTGQYSISR